MSINVPTGAKARRTLIKDITGSCRATSYDLPPESNIFGKKATGDGEGTRELMEKASVHVPSKSAVSDQDLVKCNKLAVKQSLITAKDQYDFQLSHQHVKKNTNRISMFDSPPIPFKGPFGIPSYPQTTNSDGTISRLAPKNSIGPVIGYEFAVKSAGQEIYPDVSGRVVAGKMPPVRDTVANKLKTRSPEEPDTKEPFTMRRFQNIPARVQSKF
jgi:hypothetical protein